MRLPDLCNRPPTRAPCGLVGSRAPPSGFSASWFGAIRSGRSLRRTHRVELRLTATLELRPGRTRSLGGAARGLLLSPERRRRAVAERRSVLAGAAIDRPSEQRPPFAAFSAANRVGDETSDTLCRAFNRCPAGPKLRRTRMKIARPASAAVSSKTTASSDQGAFRRRALPRPACAERHREPGPSR